jgi:hypothetical protein
VITPDYNSYRIFNQCRAILCLAASLPLHLFKSKNAGIGQIALVIKRFGLAEKAPCRIP